MTTTTIHRLATKAALARHLCWPHGPLLMDPKEVARWDREELENAHEHAHANASKE